MTDWRALGMGRPPAVPQRPEDDPAAMRDFTRGAAESAFSGLVGGPVDLATMMMRPFGYDTDKPVMGSEWVRDKMTDAGVYQPRSGTQAEGIGEVVGGAMAPGPDPMQWAMLGLGGVIKAYHGSPHTFDAFDMSKIGTGEGAQAYGHGLYFAESPGVANDYKEKLGGITRSMQPNNQIEKKATEEIKRYLDEVGWDDDVGIISMLQDKDPELRDAFKTMVAEGRSPSTPGGSMYTVDLDVDHEDLLDWDLPFSKQPEKVKKALSQTEYLYHANRMGLKDPTGGDLINKVIGDAKGSSDNLRAAGIPGIRYLDAGSRGKEDGSRNIVLFDEALAKILERNGMPVGGK